MGFVIAFVVIAYFFSMGFMLYRYLAYGSTACAIIGFAMIVLFIGSIIQVGIKENERGPCVQYETQMHYNAATKTMMPARVCVLRGELMDEDN